MAQSLRFRHWGGSGADPRPFCPVAVAVRVPVAATLSRFAYVNPRLAARGQNLATVQVGSTKRGCRGTAFMGKHPWQPPRAIVIACV